MCNVRSGFSIVKRLPAPWLEPPLPAVSAVAMDQIVFPGPALDGRRHCAAAVAAAAAARLAAVSEELAVSLFLSGLASLARVFVARRPAVVQPTDFLLI